VTELAELAARLPLALRVAAELVAARPDEPLRDLVDELGDERHRLRLLDAGGDPRAAVGAVFATSLRHLPASAIQTFHLLGLCPDNDIDAVAALTGSTLAAARDNLERLARANLVGRTAAGRYTMHDLLRVYAARGSRNDRRPPLWASCAPMGDDRG
jgi:hypothetical protein